MISGSALARGDPDLRLDQIDAGDEFRHRMLHLDAGVHFDEVQIARSHPSGTRRCRHWYSRSAFIASRAFRSIRFRSSGVTAGEGDFFDQLLMPPLDGALALAEHLDISVLSAEHLELDVPRGFDELLDVDIAAGEGGAASVCACAEIGVELGCVAHHAHAASAAAGGSFEMTG